MNFEKFEAQELTEEQLNPIIGGAIYTTTNCGTAETSSEGWDKDTDSSGGFATDTDKEMEK